jgi:hypothetical protein
MPLNQRVKESVKTFDGQKSGLPIESIGFSDAVLIENFNHRAGSLQRLNGGESYADILSSQSGGVKWLSRYKKLWIGQRGTGIACESSEDSATFIEARTNRSLASEADALTVGDRVFSVSWRDKIFLVNGRDAKIFYNQTDTITSSSYKLKLLGLDPPDSTFAFSGSWLSSNNSGNVADGTYYYLISFYDEDTNTESPGNDAFPASGGLYELSPNGILGPRPASHTVSSGPKIVAISKTNLISALQTAQASNPRITHFIIYRGTKTGSLYNSFFQVPLVDGSSTQNGNRIIRISTFITDNRDFLDSTATANLPTIALAENNSPSPTPARMKAMRDYVSGNIAGGSETPSYALADYEGFRHLEFFRDQLFAIGASSPGIYVNNVTTADGNSISGTIFNFKDLLHGSEVYQPDYWVYQWEIGVGDGQQSIGLATLGDIALLVYKENSIYYLAGTSADNYILKVMDTRHGAVHQSTIQKTPIGVIALDRSGFIKVDRIGEAELISDPIKDVIEAIDFSKSDTFYSWYDYAERNYCCAVVVGGVDTPNLTAVYNIDELKWSFDKRRGLSSYVDSGSDREVRSLIGSYTVGKLISTNDKTVVTFLGSPVRSRWVSGPITFGEEQRKKKLKWIYIKAVSNTDYTLDIRVIPDYDPSRSFIIEDFNSLTAFSTWYSSDIAADGNLIWDDGVWSSDTMRKLIKIPVSSVGYSFQIEIINKSTDPEQYGFIFENISCEGVMMGR